MKTKNLLYTISVFELVMAYLHETWPTIDSILRFFSISLHSLVNHGGKVSYPVVTVHVVSYCQF